jgi:hypothetical protein
MPRYLLLLGAVATFLIVPAPTEAFNSLAGRGCDFNGDGFDDQASSPRFEDVGAIVDAGAVNVIYGSGGGPTASGNQFWSQDSLGVLGIAETGDGMGASLTCGDFNGDGFDDLAAGVIGQQVGGLLAAGAVNVLPGSAAGLTATSDQLWSQNSSGVLGGSETGDTFGSALASGDFDGDGFDDLAIGVPGEAVGTIASAGGVNVLYGTSSLLTAGGDQFISQANSAVLDVAETGDRFGSALARGDFNGDGFDDLAIGVASEDIGAITNAGALNVLPGTSTGLLATTDQFWSQDSSGVGGIAESGDFFGGALVSGDFNRNGRDDLAVGVAGEDIGSIADAGAVNVLQGAAGLLTASGNQVWSQGTTGVLGDPERLDGFGSALGSGDFNGNGFDDLAIGIPGEDVGTIVNAGGVSVLPGSTGLLTTTSNQFWSQNSSGIAEVAESGDVFGASVATGDFNANGFDDLAIGAPLENIGTISDACLKHDIFGTSAGLTEAGDLIWSQDSPGILDTAEAMDCARSVE